jgi:ribosome recycling factor
VTLLDRVMVDYFGAPTPLNQLAGVSVSGPQSLVVTPYDKSAFKLIETAILESGLGLMPNNEGTLLRLNIPPLTEDRRKELTKMAKGIGEEGKVAVRNIRRDAVDKIKKLEKDKAIGKDESQDGQEAVQKITDKFTKVVEDVLKAKEKEIMTV